MGVALGAAALVVAAELGLSAEVPPPQYPEVEDGLAQLAGGDPTVLVLGSSHLRSFAEMAAELERRTGGAERMVAVPVDWGKASSYRWTFDHRVRPLLDERDETGARVRTSLRRVLLVTQWWDFRVLGPDDPPLVNLPARAWAFRDWLTDVWRNGVTPYNQNYVVHRFSRLFRGSVLVQARGHNFLLDWFKGAVRPETAAAARDDRYRERLRHFRGYVERGGERLFDPVDVAAFDAIVDECKARGLDVTVILFPRMHGMVTDRARASPIDRFSSWMAGRCSELGVRLLDLSWDHPLTDADFGQDLDHPTEDANRRFAAWALDTGLRFLVHAGRDRENARGGTP